MITRDKSRGRSKSRPRMSMKCYNCGKTGHYAKECWLSKRDKSHNRNRDRKKEDKQAMMAVAFDGDIVFVCNDGCVNITCQDSTWVVDSMASFYITSWHDYFASYRDSDFGYVRMRNNGVSKVIDMGDVYLETNVGCNLFLKNVRHVPNIRLYLISIGTLDDNSYCNSFFDGKWKLTKCSTVVAKGKKTGSLYTMHADLIKKR